jgi:hypothetical protein
MSILDVFRSRSRTASWREDSRIRLVADLDLFELNDVGFGRGVAALSFLGPSESKGFDYPSKGLQLEVGSEGRFEGLVLALRDGVYLGQTKPERVRRFAGRIRVGGREWAPMEMRGESDFIAAWGDPYWRDQDEDETLLFFEFDRGEVQVELTLEGVPQVLVATPEPLLADPAQRESYGVTKPWPPSGLASAS